MENRAEPFDSTVSSFIPPSPLRTVTENNLAAFPGGAFSPRRPDQTQQAIPSASWLRISPVLGWKTVDAVDPHPHRAVVRVIALGRQDLDVGLAQDDEQVAFPGVLQVVGHVQVGVSCGPSAPGRGRACRTRRPARRSSHEDASFCRPLPGWGGSASGSRPTRGARPRSRRSAGDACRGSNAGPGTRTASSGSAPRRTVASSLSAQVYVGRSNRAGAPPPRGNHSGRRGVVALARPRTQRAP